MTLFKKIRGWIGSLVIAIILSLLIGIFVFQPYKVDGHSMDPTLHDNQRVFISKLNHTFSYLPDYGDIVIIDSRVNRKRSLKDDILENPIFQLILNRNDHNFYVKRVIGKPGDVLEFKDHKVYRNGEPLDEPYINGTMNYTSDKEWIVPKKHIFVMGDNRNHSEDSRMIGYIPLNHIIGKKIF